MLRINDIKIGIADKVNTVETVLAKKLNIKEDDIAEINIVKESLDVRRKSNINRVYTLDFRLKSWRSGTVSEKVPSSGKDILNNKKTVGCLDEEKRFAQKYGLKIVESEMEPFYEKIKKDLSSDIVSLDVDTSDRNKNRENREQAKFYTLNLDKKGETLFGNENMRPVVAGFGPAGMFAGLTLAKAGFNPIIIERGGQIHERKEKIKKLWENGILDEECNVQFGEGGAGTFSDGKLTTGIKDRRIRTVIKTISEYGGGEELLYKQRPHVGTDKLETVVVNIRKEIEKLGGEILFNTKLVNIISSDSRISEITVEKNGIEKSIKCRAVILAIGHSARDTFKMLYEKDIKIEKKPFSMGVRIEHKQDMIDRSQYGDDFENIYGMTFEEAGMPAAEYKLSYRCKNGRGVYTFCMCPGGFVIASSSSSGRIVTNGMSFSDRDGNNANSAVLAEIRPEDMIGDSPLAGIELQEHYEKLAFELGGSNYFAPATRVGDFLKLSSDKNNSNKKFSNGKHVNENNVVQPTYRPGVSWRDITECLPDFVVDSIREALPEMGKKIRGFDDPEAILTAIESRSSSPVRIVRGDDYQSSLNGLYPCGEGAGYAGGITSAAVDGIKVAESIILNLVTHE